MRFLEEQVSIKENAARKLSEDGMFSLIPQMGYEGLIAHFLLPPRLFEKQFFIVIFKFASIHISNTVVKPEAISYSSSQDNHCGSIEVSLS